METAKFDRNTITITTEDGGTICKSSGSVLKFDGFLKVFPSPSKDEDEAILPEMSKGPINIESLIDEQHFTQPPPRYSEASLVKKLEELGIGRPSTYASIISTIANRGYAEILNKRFFPTDRGKLISAFLEKLFSKYVDYNFTAGLEDQLDEITTGKESWIKVLEMFWKDFNNNVSEVKEKRTREVLDLLNESLGTLIFDKDKDGKVVRKCQLCDTGSLSLKNSFRGGAFIGCSNYPECKFTRPLSKAKAAAQSQLAEPKFIGKHENGNDIFLKNGRFGPYLQYEKIPEEKTEEKITKKKKKTKKLKADVNELLKNVSIPKGLELESIDLEKAQFLCSLPKSLGLNPENQKEITLNTGRFGPYLKCENKSARIENIEEIFSIGLNRAITLIAEAKPGRMSSSIIKDLGEHPEDKKPVRVMKGQYGPYIKYKSLNATIPEEKDPTDLTMEEALILIEKRKEYDKNKKSKKKKKGKIMNFEDKIKELKIELPEAKAPVGNYVATKIVGNLLYVSGQVSINSNGELIKGKVGKDLTTDEAYKAAERCGISIISQVKKACEGDLSKVKSCIKLTGFVNSTDDYTEQPKVINGASDLIASIFGDAGMHTRAAVSTNSLPLGVSVEVDAIFELN